jgi:hypothetical protein
MEQQHLYSVLSKASYDFYHHSAETAQKELNEYRTGYTLNKELSNKNAVVMNKGDDIVISYRGTDLKNPSDLLADAEILLGRDKIKIFLNDRFDEANELYTKVKNKYPKSDITLTGHSLGSAEAIYVGTKNNTKSVSFNEGTSPIDAVLSQFGNKEASKKQIVYLTGKDILSNLSILEPYDTRVVKGKKEDPFFTSHSLNYFLPERPKKDIGIFFQPVRKALKRTPKVRFDDTYGQDFFKEVAKQRALVY